MNQQECRALFADSHISDRERSLYLYLRWHMDFTSGVVGAKRRISYQGIREHLEFRPERGSREPISIPTKDQIKRALRKLERYGWIERMHESAPGENMVFRLPLATVGKVRPNEESHMSATEAPPQSAPHGAPQENPVITGDSSDMSATRNAPRSAKGAPQHERHTSDLSDQDPLSLEGRGDFLCGHELNCTSDFILVAKTTGLQLDDEQLSGVFQSFCFHAKHRNTSRTLADWLAEWRVWCGREKSYARPKHLGKSNEQNGSSGTRAKSATARVFEQSRAFSGGS